MTARWSKERINATVKEDYIERELGSKKYIQALHGVLAFGDGLTDDTYLDWILERSPCIFLILNQIGVPEKIFEIIDKSFADDDLPLSQDALWELNLFGGKSETLDRKFYREQYNFLVQELEPGGHVDYGPWEVIPVDPVAKRPGIATHQSSSDRVHVHRKLYTRKKVLTLGDNGIDEVYFSMHLKALSSIKHTHLVTVWATYSQDDFSYILLSPPAEMSLKTFLDEPPKTFRMLEKHERRDVFLSWTHCITSALAYLHDKGFAHQSLRPSTIFVDQRNTIFLNDYNALKALDVEEHNNNYNAEFYEHSAPEHWLRKPCLHETTPLKTYLPGGGRTSRKLPRPVTSSTKKSFQLPSTSTSQSFNRTDSRSGSSGSSTNTRPRNALITTFAPSQGEGSIASSFTHKGSYASDIFSHSTILLLLLSQILQHSPKSFASHRSRLNRQAGRGNAPPDSSFHKNLGQVTKWIDTLAKEAGQREKKDMKFWGAVVEVVQICKLGIRKEPKERVESKDMEHKIAGWVHWGLGRRRTCSCMIHEEKDTRPKMLNNAGSEPELASQYQILKPQGSARQLTGVKQRVGYPVDSHHYSLVAASMVQQNGSTRSTSTSTIDKGPVWALSDLARMHPETSRPDSLMSGKESTVWGLDDVSSDFHSGESWSDQNPSRNSESAASISTSCQAIGRAGGLSMYDDDYDDDDDGDSTDTETQHEREDWPLPLGTLTLSR